MYLQVSYLGLADLGKTLTAEPGQMYEQVNISEENKKIILQINKDGGNCWICALVAFSHQYVTVINDHG